MTALDAAVERQVLLLALMVGGLSREGAEAKVCAFEAAHRAVVLREAADAVDRAADDLEAQAIEADGQAYGRTNKTVAAWRDAAAVPRRLAYAATPTSKEEER